MATTGTQSDHSGRRFSPWRLLPLLALAAAAGLVFALDLDHYLTFEALRDNRERLLGWVRENQTAAAIGFVVIYATAIVVVPPSGLMMTLTGGFVFGAVACTAYVVVGATAGATGLFLAARYSLGDWFRSRAGPAMHRMEAGFREDEMSYMLVLRLVPLFPFWLVNLAPAFLGVRLRTFVIGTFFGIIPGTAVFSTIGAGLGSILDNNEDLSMAGALTPEVVAGLVGLALLALIPVVYKKYRKHKAPRDQQ